MVNDETELPEHVRHQRLGSLDRLDRAHMFIVHQKGEKSQLKSTFNFIYDHHNKL